MNRRLVLHLLGAIVLLEALTMVPAALVSLFFQEQELWAFVKTIALLCVIGVPLRVFSKPSVQNLRAREGFLVVALSWVLLSVFGALPFVSSGMLPHFIDAFFEAVSGFTTTGATVLTQIDGQARGILFWRSFTHWVGGMGVLVLTLALLPQMTGRTSHLIRAESPGPSLSKLVPKIGDMAKILYLIYSSLTLIEAGFLMAAGLDWYDALIHAFGTAGTGGFSNYGASVGHFNSAWVDGIITVFMVLFGLNFALFYRLLLGQWRDALKNEELHWYMGIVAISVLVITLLITPQYENFLTALRYGSFQVASIVSTTGYATADFIRWPQAAKFLLVFLMFIGSCAGSTAGGMKVVRVAILCKLGRREIRHTFQPRKMQVVRFEGKGVEEHMLSQIAVFFFVYLALVVIGTFLICLENKFDFETNLTAAITCVSNVGPGLGFVGPVESFAGYGVSSKLILSLLMLCGRLELFPILVLFHPAAWQK